MTFELRKFGQDPFFNFFYPSKRILNSGFSMKTDVKEDEHSYYMDIELAGVKKEDIDISLKDGYLTISAKREQKNDEQNSVRTERFYGMAERSFYVGLTEEKNISAQYEDGVLSLKLPKEEDKKELAHKIHIN